MLALAAGAWITLLLTPPSAGAVWINSRNSLRVGQDIIWPNPRPGLQHNLRKEWLRRHHMDVSSLLELCGSERIDTVLLGDSISEQWRRPTFSGNILRPLTFTNAEALPNDTSFETSFGVRAGLAAIGGDTIADLGWRLHHQLGDALRKCAPRRVHLLIGTNDLGHGKTPGQMAASYRKLGDDLLSLLDREVLFPPERGPKLIFQTLMPRGAFLNKALCKPNCLGAREQAEQMPDELQWTSCPDAHKMPPLPGDNSSSCAEFFPMISEANELIASTAAALRGKGFDAEVLDCTSFFLDAKGRLSKEFFPDFLHPNAAGHRRWRDCLHSAPQ